MGCVPILLRKELHLPTLLYCKIWPCNSLSAFKYIFMWGIRQYNQGQNVSKAKGEARSLNNLLDAVLQSFI